jgi:hypothetical protein
LLNPSHYVIKYPFRFAEYFERVIKDRIIMTTWPSKNPSFPGLTRESRKALDARLRPAGMTRKQEWNFKMCQFNYETLNKPMRRSRSGQYLRR